MRSCYWLDRTQRTPCPTAIGLAGTPVAGSGAVAGKEIIDVKPEEQLLLKVNCGCWRMSWVVYLLMAIQHTVVLSIELQGRWGGTGWTQKYDQP